MELPDGSRSLDGPLGEIGGKILYVQVAFRDGGLKLRLFKWALQVSQLESSVLQMHGRFPTADTRDRAHEVMQQLGLEKKADIVSGNLSHGDQKLLDIALALVLNPKVLLLDEPVAGMGPEERTQMIDTVYALWKQGGLTVVLIEHDMEIVFRISQHIHVLSYGKLLAQGNPEQIRTNPAVIEAYLGTPKEARA